MSYIDKMYNFTRNDIRIFYMTRMMKKTAPTTADL